MECKFKWIQKVMIIKIVLLLLIVILYIPQTSALEVIVQNLPTELLENDNNKFEVEISDYSYASYISIETNIEKKDTTIFDFGELNEKYGGVDRYKQSVILETPKDLNSFKVTITGKTPSGTSKSNINDVEITKFNDGDLKYYEIKLLGENKEELGQKNRDSRTFKLIINDKLLFEKDLRDIKGNELDEAKTVTKDMFYRGLVKDANKMVSALRKVRSSESEGLIPYTETWKNVVLIGFILVIFFIGYIEGQKEE